MEFVAGGDLQGHARQAGTGGKLPETKVLRWARQMLDVLQFLHSQTPPIIYRDLKPGNIMIDQARPRDAGGFRHRALPAARADAARKSVRSATRRPNSTSARWSRARTSIRSPPRCIIC